MKHSELQIFADFAAMDFQSSFVLVVRVATLYVIIQSDVVNNNLVFASRVTVSQSVSHKTLQSCKIVAYNTILGFCLGQRAISS